MSIFPFLLVPCHLCFFFLLYQQIINYGPIQHGMVSSHLPLVIRFTTVCENVDCVVSDVIVKHCGITFFTY